MNRRWTANAGRRKPSNRQLWEHAKARLFEEYRNYVGIGQPPMDAVAAAWHLVTNEVRGWYGLEPLPLPNSVHELRAQSSMKESQLDQWTRNIAPMADAEAAIPDHVWEAQGQESQQDGPQDNEWTGSGAVAHPTAEYYARRAAERDAQLAAEMAHADAHRGAPDRTELAPYAGNVGRPHVPSWGEREPEPEYPPNSVEARQARLESEMNALDEAVSRMSEDQVEDALNEESGNEVTFG